MGASEETLIDTLCPHGRESHQPVTLSFIDDSGRWGSGQGVIFNPDDDAMASEWIAADRDAFVEVGSR